MLKKDISPIQRLFGIISASKREVAQIYWLAAFSGLMSLSLPFGIQMIINFIQGGTYSVSYYVLVILIILGMLFYAIIQIIELRILENIQRKIFVYAGMEFAYRFPNIKIAALMNINARDIANRFFDSVVLEKSITKLLTDFSISAIQIMLSALVMCFYHSGFILVNIIVTVICYLGFKYTFKKTMYAGIDYSKLKYRTAYWIEEIAGASSTFKLAGITDLPMSRTDKILTEYLKKREIFYRGLNTQYIILNISKLIYIIGFLLIGGIMVMERIMNIGQFVATEVLVLTIINGIDKFTHTLKSMYDTLISVEKLAEVTDLELEEENKNSQYKRIESGMHISVINLSFKYPGSQKFALKHINLEIQPKEKVLITGANNSGKTTLIKVLSSLYKIDDGDIKYNGISIKNINIAELRYDIGIYFQEDVIFNGTIWDNITLGRKNIDKEYVDHIAKKINLSKEIEALPDGYNTELHAHGFGYSVTVINKIIFLRVVATQPKLLLMENMHFSFFQDERAHFIDILTDKNAPWTLVCVAEMDELARKFDTICIMDNGEIKQKGTYSEIFKK